MPTTGRCVGGVPGRGFFTCRMRLPLPCSRPPGSASCAPWKKPTFTSAGTTAHRRTPHPGPGHRAAVVEELYTSSRSGAGSQPIPARQRPELGRAAAQPGLDLRIAAAAPREPERLACACQATQVERNAALPGGLMRDVGCWPPTRGSRCGQPWLEAFTLQLWPPASKPR